MRTATMATLTLLLTCTAAFAQQKGTFTDPRDKKKYETAKIGGLIWFAENLGYNAKGSYCPGEEELNETIECEKNGKRTKCLRIECLEWADYLDRKAGDYINFCPKDKASTAKQIQDKKKEIQAKAQAECAKSGRKYDQEIAKKACPAGWHLPNEEEWGDLKRTIGFNSDEYGFKGLGYGSSYIRCVQENKAYTDSVAKAEAAEKAAIAKNSGVFTDSRDSKKYKTIKIGEQTWMAENLNYNASGSVCYEDKPANCDKYGRLYDWKSANEVCPKDWRLPSRGEINALANYAGTSSAGDNLMAKSWKYTVGGGGEVYEGKDKHGFAALPVGSRYPSGEFSRNDSGSGTWWTSSEKSDKAAYGWRIKKAKGQVFVEDLSKNNSVSVRCLQGAAPAPAPAPAPAKAPATAPAKQAAPAGNPSKPMYCVSSVMNNPVSCMELTDTPADKSICDKQNGSMKMMMGKAEWTANKPSIPCEKMRK